MTATTTPTLDELPPDTGTFTPHQPGRARRLAGDSATMVRRGIAHWARQPGQILANLAFSVMMLIMFAYFLGGGMVVGGGGDYVDFLVPGMLVLTMAFGMEATMVELTSDINRGILDRFRSMPIAPSSVLVGRTLLDLLNSTIGLAVLIGAGWAIGWRWHAGVTELLAALGLLLLLRFAMLWLGVWLALVAGRPEMVQTVQILVWPLSFLSSVFVSPDTMPGWIGTLADWNPISATAGAVRELFGNPAWPGDSWAAQHPEPLAVLWPLAMLAVFVPLALRRFSRLGA
ncbi:ABC transporter permease [Streptomyces sp. 3MP-14]|uniref:Transport permease protein n=1 Tax=Streptomyces mimosae TaxID=2586635 RepID=A0A5N6A8M5_9ACTN|nr:ABC transporter permease [Streptomyces mimosae]KAB8175271.1 ABC transporter permease [Streptomyces sp. 3MP-14]